MPDFDPTPEQELQMALKVFTLSPRTRAWLEKNDPMALKQAEAALVRWEATRVASMAR